MVAAMDKGPFTDAESLLLYGHMPAQPPPGFHFDAAAAQQGRWGVGAASWAARVHGAGGASGGGGGGGYKLSSLLGRPGQPPSEGGGGAEGAEGAEAAAAAAAWGEARRVRRSQRAQRLSHSPFAMANPNNAVRVKLPGPGRNWPGMPLYWQVSRCASATIPPAHLPYCVTASLASTGRYWAGT